MRHRAPERSTPQVVPEFRPGMHQVFRSASQKRYVRSNTTSHGCDQFVSTGGCACARTCCAMTASRTVKSRAVAAVALPGCDQTTRAVNQKVRKLIRSQENCQPVPQFPRASRLVSHETASGSLGWLATGVTVQCVDGSKEYVTVWITTTKMVRAFTSKDTPNARYSALASHPPDLLHDQRISDLCVRCQHQRFAQND